MGGEKKRAVLSVRGIDCAACALAIEKRLKRLGGVKDVGSAIMLNKIFIDYDDSKVSLAEIRRAIKDTGYSSYVAMDAD